MLCFLRLEFYYAVTFVLEGAMSICAGQHVRQCLIRIRDIHLVL